jgi:TolA-binding protein
MGRRHLVTVLALFLLLGFTAAVVGGQQSAQPPMLPAEVQQTEQTTSQENESSPPYVVRVRLPNFFGLIGLQADQRSELRKVAEKYDRRIAELRYRISQMEGEIRQLLREKEKACEALLTDEQRKRLEELRQQAARRRNRAGAGETSESATSEPSDQPTNSSSGGSEKDR